MPESPSEDIAAAVRGAREWIEAVTGRRFPADRSFRAGLEDGVLLCELMETITPGLIRKINRSSSPIAYLDNVQQFLLGCKDLGLNEDQLFDMMDLQDPSHSTHRDEQLDLDDKLKSVCVTLFWLSQAVEFVGPQLNLTAFKTLVPQLQLGSVAVVTSSPEEGEDSLTIEEEQTADQLLADIQNTVDEMLNDFHANSLAPEDTPPPSNPPFSPSFTSSSSSSSSPSQLPYTASSTSPATTSTASIDNWSHQIPADSPHVKLCVEMSSSGHGFGFQVRGGSDTMTRAQVDMVLPGSAAEDGGLRSGDEITTVNGQDVVSLKHFELVAAIRKAGTEGHISIGLLRVSEDGERGSEPPPLEEQQRHAAALKRMYPKSHHFLDSQLGLTLTPVLEEDFDLSPPLPPLPGEPLALWGSSVSPLPPLPGEDPSSPTPYISPLPPLPGEQTPSGVLPEVAALASVRGSVREMESLQQSMDTPTYPSSPPHLSPPTDAVKEGEKETVFTSEDLDTIVQDLRQEGVASGLEGVASGGEERERAASDQPWEPKAQWEDSVWVGEGEKKKAKKIWSFLEEKTRVSSEERAQAGGNTTAQAEGNTTAQAGGNTAAPQQKQTPIIKKPPPPKVLPKPAHRRNSSGQRDSQSTEIHKEEKELETPHVNGPIPSPDPNMITIQSTSSSEPLNVRPVTGEEMELHGDIKIQKVAHTRWVPPKRSPEQIQCTMSTPAQSYVPGPPPADPLSTDLQQSGQYGGSGRRAPPTHIGPVKQQSLPQFSPHKPPQAQGSVARSPHHPWQQQRSSKSQSLKLAEQTRVSGPPRGPPRGRVQSSSVPSAQVNGGPSYDSLSNVAREIHRQQQQQQAKARSRTWGARERNQFMGQPIHSGRPALTLPDQQKQDGLQQAFLVNPADPHLPCSLCHMPVGPQPPLIAIPGLHLHFHPHCFVCPVCHTYLFPSRGNKTTVMVRNMRPHCHYCTSNTQGVQATEC